MFYNQNFVEMKNNASILRDKDILQGSIKNIEHSSAEILYFCCHDIILYVGCKYYQIYISPRNTIFQ